MQSKVETKRATNTIVSDKVIEQITAIYVTKETSITETVTEKNRRAAPKGRHNHFIATDYTESTDHAPAI